MTKSEKIARGRFLCRVRKIEAETGRIRQTRYFATLRGAETQAQKWRQRSTAKRAFRVTIDSSIAPVQFIPRAETGSDRAITREAIIAVLSAARAPLTAHSIAERLACAPGHLGYREALEGLLTAGTIVAVDRGPRRAHSYRLANGEAAPAARVIRALTEATGPLSQRGICDRVGGNSRAVRAAIADLIDSGEVVTAPGPGNTILHRLADVHREPVAHDADRAARRAARRAAGLGDEVRQVLTDAGRPLTKAEIHSRVPARLTDVRRAVADLIDSGEVVTAPGPRGTILHRLAARY